ncbi:hypothetical protein [Tenggerimyces flavus]|uniref:Uncharacterized protein n=1 Tax=Tenggerimyces flavus TaxID=1708749 RepID=A0ABV7YDW4_9ACTN|nr:hypothetical protein [Tenggerimyces flavus]MBM7784253.1 hypothetical protein [Tenggerimyces flavus]
MKPTNDLLTRAGDFIWLTARVLEQRRYEHLFHHGSADAVLTALSAYENPDGGYAYALEPDNRGPNSQPNATISAVSIFEEVKAIDSDRAQAAVDYFGSVVLPDGSTPVLVPGYEGFPNAPWIVPDPDGGGSVLLTALMMATLYRSGVERPWMAKSTDYLWTAIESIEKTHPYEAIFAMLFLDQVPDRDRAARAAERLGRIVRDGNLVVLDHSDPSKYEVEGYAPGEVFYAHDYAPRPTSLARAWFSDTELAEALDHLEAEQGEDGGWPVTMKQWAPGTHLEWRPIQTLGVLATLKAYERV